MSLAVHLSTRPVKSTPPKAVMKCKRACYNHHRHWHLTSAAEKREPSSSKIHRQYKHVAERAASRSSCTGLKASIRVSLINCRPPCAPVSHTTITTRLPQELSSRHRASAGSACSTGVWLRVQSPRPARLGQRPPMGCPLPMLQSKGGLVSMKGSVWRAKRQQLQVAHCLPDAGL